MAAASPTRRRRAAAPAAALAAVAVLGALAAALVVGRADPGGLKDQGPSQPVTPSPRAQPLWPGLNTPSPPSTAATETASASQAPPQPVPDLIVPGRDITAVDVRAVLTKDPDVNAEERPALGSCTGCAVRSPEFRDLTGDGKPELITAVAVPQQVVLHVYALVDDRLVPILRVKLLPLFSAETIGTDLWLHEQTSATVQTTTHYRWDGVRLARLEQKFEGTGRLPGPADAPDPVTSVVPPGGRAPGPSRPVPQPAAPTATPTALPSPLAPRTAARPTPALPGVQP
ncbi:hypothetical protein PUR71_28345 [Streptomyces sp. SP17BM10]|uniref:hypothetical protein n=1 Tax=Streptomyces sp. SP17BM10 TaxID=3002530 RepID=UPI002E79947A|nr:hypothetical protein [Streptomyces sp. SP17BM10]MEE1786783.1 hypothetical protein [Streptomyces sp. SP17BM10]